MYVRVCVCIVPYYIASARHGMAYGCWRGPSTARNNALRVWDNTITCSRNFPCSVPVVYGHGTADAT